MNLRTYCLIGATISATLSFPVIAEQAGEGSGGGLFPKWLRKKEVSSPASSVPETREKAKAESTPSPPRQSPAKVSRIDPDTDTIAPLLRAEPVPATPGDAALAPYPSVSGYNTLAKASQKDIEELIGRIFKTYEQRIARMDPPDLRDSMASASGFPVDFPTAWRDQVAQPLWPAESTRPRTLADLYRVALEHSQHLKVYADVPLIRETGIQEADGDFDVESFIEGRITRRNDPIGSSLTTGNTAARFLEHEDYLEGGIRKRTLSGAQVTLSNRLATLSSNSAFLIPQNQGTSEFVLSWVQPVLQGGGVNYNQSKIKIAKLEARSASAEFLRQVESHLLEVTNAYWELYHARARLILSRELVGSTSAILQRLEQRADLDALESEVLRARASLEMRKARVNRAEVEVRNSEERLRALVNDPSDDIGSNRETLPVTPPLAAHGIDPVQAVAKDALHHRPEIQQGFDALRAAIVRRDVHRNEKLPTLNLVAELMLGDVEANDRAGTAFQNQFGDGTGYSVGFQFSQPWDNDAEKARLLRSDIELRQQVSRLRAIVDIVLLESLVHYRELMAAYRDMQGSHATLRASREELRQLQDRLEIDTGEEVGRTTPYQLQLILDSMDRNQAAEELFLSSIVAYNASFAALQRARGVFLDREEVKIQRHSAADPVQPGKRVEKIEMRTDSPFPEASAKPADPATREARPSLPRARPVR